MEKIPLKLLLLLLLPAISAYSQDAFFTEINIEVGTVQRENKPFTIKNLNKEKGRWEWRVFDSENDSVPLFTSQEKEPTFSLPKGHYDILVTANGANTLSRHFRRIITVLPPVFTEQEADEVIDLSAADTSNLVKDYKNVVRPGYKILMKGTFNGRIKITGLRGTREKPVHIINGGQVVINSTNDAAPYALQWNGHNQYILIDGKATPGIPYGFKITGHPSKPGQVFFIGGEFNKGFDLCGVRIVGRQGITEGASCIQVQPTYSPACNASNWNFEYFTVNNSRLEEASNEGFYIGYFTDKIQQNGNAPYRLGKVLIYRDTVVNSGWDAIQVGSADMFEVHNNYVESAGLAASPNHSSFFSWNDGNAKGYCYRNTFRNAVIAFSIGYGRTGGEAYIYNNLLIEGKHPDSVRGQAFIFSKLDNQYRNISVHIFNNTIVTGKKALKLLYRKTVKDTPIPITFAGNAILMGKKNERKFPDLDIDYGMPDSAAWTVKNVWRLVPQKSELQWTADYRPASLTSPLTAYSFNVAKEFPSLPGGFYDHDGYPMYIENKGYTYGSFSALKLFSESNRKKNGVH